MPHKWLGAYRLHKKPIENKGAGARLSRVYKIRIEYLYWPTGSTGIKKYCANFLDLGFVRVWRLFDYISNDVPDSVYCQCHNDCDHRDLYSTQWRRGFWLDSLRYRFNRLSGLVLFICSIIHIVIYELDSTAQDTHGYFNFRQSVDIVALSADLLLAGSASTTTCWWV